MNDNRPRYWIPSADPLRVLVAIILAIIIILLLLRGCGSAVVPTILGPGAGAQPAAGNPINLNGVAAPNATVRIFDGDKQIGETTADANGNWKFTLPAAALAAGAHQLTARAFLNNAPAGVSTPLGFSVLAAAVPTTAPPTVPPPTTAPTVAAPTAAAPTATPTPAAAAVKAPVIASPSSGAALTVGSLGSISGAADPGAKVQIFDGDKLLGEVTADASGKWSFVLPSAVGVGAHSISAKALDSAGKAVASAPLAVTVAEAVVAPTLDSPASGAKVNAGDTVLSGTGKPNSEAQVLVDGKVVGTAKVGADGKWSFTVRLDAAGDHTVGAQVADASGKAVASAKPATVTVVLPAVLPTTGSGDDDN